MGLKPKALFYRASMGLLIGLVTFACTNKSLIAPNKTYYMPFSTDNECDEFADNYGKLSIQKIRARDGRCEILVKPSDYTHHTFRSYQISSTGMLMVFNSFGEGLSASTNGTRSYFFFPRSIHPRFTSSLAGEIEVTMSSGEKIIFSPHTKKIQSISGGIQFKEATQITGKNRGGLEIGRYPRGLILDTGWQTGGIAHQNPWRVSVFIDSNGNRCEVRNDELFEMRGDEPYLKYEHDYELVRFVEKRCAELDLDVLKGRL